MLLDHADALVLQGEIIINQEKAKPTFSLSDLQRAQDSTYAGLEIARKCDYLWAERDLVDLLVKIAVMLSDTTTASKHEKEALAVRNLLQLKGGEPIKTSPW
jgi:hypothetical protein